MNSVYIKTYNSFFILFKNRTKLEFLQILTEDLTFILSMGYRLNK